MIVFTDNEGRILDVESTSDSSLNRYELVDEANPFKGWSRHKITCYRITVQPQVVTNVIASREETYIDEEGITQTTVVEDTETVPTGLYYVTMMTPYIDSREVKRYGEIGDDIIDTDIRMDEAEEDIALNEETLGFVMEETLPSMENLTNINADAIEYILTKLLPLLEG